MDGGHSFRGAPHELSSRPRRRDLLFRPNDTIPDNAPAAGAPGLGLFETWESDLHHDCPQAARAAVLCSQRIASSTCHGLRPYSEARSSMDSWALKREPTTGANAPGPVFELSKYGLTRWVTFGNVPLWGTYMLIQYWEHCAL